MISSRPVSWIKAARKNFEDFPSEVQLDVLRALTIAAEGGKADTAKPFKGVEGGVFEIALRHRGNAYRVVYALQLARDIVIIHAFQKKSKAGIKTPLPEVNLIRERIKRMKETRR